MQTLFTTAGYISVGLLLVNLLVYTVNFRRLPEVVQRLGPYMVVYLVTEIAARIVKYSGESNLFLLHGYTLLEFLTLSYFYYGLFRHRRGFYRNFRYFVLVVSLLLVANTIWLEPLTVFNSNAKTLVQLCLISYAVYYFFISFGKIDLSAPYHRAVSFINFAIILYYSGSLFIFMSSKMLIAQGLVRERTLGFWALNAILLIIFQSLILLSLWTVASRNKKSSSSSLPAL